MEAQLGHIAVTGRAAFVCGVPLLAGGATSELGGRVRVCLCWTADTSTHTWQDGTPAP